MKTRLGVAALFFFIVGLVGACGEVIEESEDRLTITIFHSKDIGFPDSTPSITHLRVSVIDLDTNEILSQELISSEAEGHTGLFEGIPFGDNLQLVVEALGSIGLVVVSGVTPPFDIAEENGPSKELRLYMTPIGELSPLCAIFNGPAVQPSYFASEARSNHTMTMLDDGQVMVVGGANTQGLAGGIGDSAYSSFHDSIELFNIATNYFDQPVNSFGGTLRLEQARARHRTVRLPSGQILVIGGLTSGDGETLEASDVVDIINVNEGGEFSMRSISLNQARFDHEVVVRDDGTVFVIGGKDYDDAHELVYLDSIEVLEPGQSAFVEVASLNQARAEFQAVLADQGVVAMGGRNQEGALKTVELISYNSAGQVVALEGPLMPEARYGHKALTHVASGDQFIVVAGGIGEDGAALDSVLVFDIFGYSWRTDLGPFKMQVPRAHMEMLELPTGDIFLAGGMSAEQAGATDAELLLYRPETDFNLVSYAVYGELSAERVDAASVLLNNGMVLISGGASLSSGYYSISHRDSDLFNPGLPEALSL